MGMRDVSLVLVLACGFIGFVSAQKPRSHDALAVARHHAAAQNQRILLVLSGGGDTSMNGLQAALPRRLVRYEYVVTGQPAASLAGLALRSELGLVDATLPIVAVLDAKGALIAYRHGEVTGSKDGMKGFLEKHTAKPVDARSVLSRGLESAKATKRHVLLYLSAPW